MCNTTIELICGYLRPLTDKDNEMIENMNYWFDGVVGISIVLIGLIMNTIACVVLLTNKSMKQLIYHLLSALFIINNVFLFTQLINKLYYDFKYQALIFLIPYLIYPIEKSSISATVFCIVSLAHQSYRMAYDPEKYRRIYSLNTLRKKHAKSYILSSLILAFIINIPRWFSYKVVLQNDTTSENEYKIVHTHMKSKFEYVVFYENFVLHILTLIAPMTLLVFYNWSAHNMIQDRQLELSRLSSIYKVGRSESKEYADQWKRIKIQIKSTALNKEVRHILIVIIFIFIICHLPRCFTKFYDGMYTPYILKIFEYGQRLLLILYAASTPIVYIRGNKKFWKHLTELIYKLSSGKISMRKYQSGPNVIIPLGNENSK